MKIRGESMIEKAFGTSRKHRLFRTLVFATVLLPSMAVMAIGTHQLYGRMTEQALERRAVIAELAGRTVQGRLDSTVELARSLATRVAFNEHVAAGRWEDAARILESVPADFPYVDRLFLTDVEGVLMADQPHLPGVVGQNFSDRDWYRGVTAAWTPYVSEVYQRAAEPRINVVAVAVPIRVTDEAPIAGILVLQLSLDTLFSWVAGIDTGGSGSVYMTDRHGTVMAHPEFAEPGRLVDFSDVPSVRDAISGSTGVKVSYNPVEEVDRMTATWRSPAYGFVSVAYEPVSAAFAHRDRELRDFLGLCGIILALELVFAFVLWRLVRSLYSMREKERAFLESIGDGVIAVDRSWKIILWNRTASQLTGWTAKEAMGRPFRQHVRFIRERDRKENLAFIEEAMLFGETRPMANSTILMTRDGREIPISDSAAPLFDEDGEVSGVVIIFRDATREKDASMLRSDFAYASHQLRTPVNKAMWDLEAALEEVRDDALRDKLQVAYHAIRDVQKLSTRLIDVSQIDQRQIVPTYAETKVVSIIKEVLKAVENEAKERKVQILVKPVQPELVADTDPKLLRTALQEIVENAVLYGGTGSTVEIHAQVEKLELVFHVMDRGIGISDEQKPLIFTKFFRGQNVPQDAHGAGLGLFIAREYVRLIGGKVWFESKLGFGTTFTVSIPRVRGMKE